MVRMRVVLMGLLVVGILALGLTLLDFRIAESSDNTQTEMARMTLGLEAGATLPPPGSLRIHVAGGESLSAYLKTELAQQWAAKSGARDMEIVSSLSDQADGPALMVQPEESSVSWTPIFARASISIKIVYASDGDLSWRDDRSVVMSTRDGRPQIRVRGDLKLEDTTRGLVSRPAYQRHLAERIAMQVSDVLWKQLSGKN